MAVTTKIEFCKHTWSPWRGCQHAVMQDGTAHPGCDHCYAETMSKRNPGILGQWGDTGTRIISATKSWEQVKRWDTAAANAGGRESIFPSLCDPFEDWHHQLLATDGRPAVKVHHWGKFSHFSSCNLRGGNDALMLSDARWKFFELIYLTPNLDWLLFTKRTQNIRKFWTGKFRPNVRLIYSASDQKSLESGIDDLLACRDLCPVLGLSLEPLVGSIDLSAYIDRLDWVIVGGESGPHARNCDVQWIRSILQQCRVAGVPCFNKQLGAKPYWGWPYLPSGIRVRKNNHAILNLRDKKGGDWNEWPADLRVREFPEVTA